MAKLTRRVAYRYLGIGAAIYVWGAVKIFQTLCATLLGCGGVSRGQMEDALPPAGGRMQAVAAGGI